LPDWVLAGVLSNCLLTGGPFFAGQSWLGGVHQIDGQIFSDLPAACNCRVHVIHQKYSIGCLAVTV
jgi:hypothetical protein